MNRQYRLVKRNKREKAPFPSFSFLLALVVMISIFYGFFRFARYMITESQMFQLQNIEVEGSNFIKQKEIIRLAGVQQGVKLFQISKESIAERLLRNPYLKGVSVGRSIPSTLIISIQERQPMAYLVDKKIYMVDPTGKILLKKPKMQFQDLPLITGIPVGQLLKNREPLYEALQLIRKIQGVDGTLFQFISEIHLSKNKPPRLYLIRGSAQVHLGREQIHQRIYTLCELIKRTEILNQLKDIKIIDLTYNNRVVVSRKN